VKSRPPRLAESLLALTTTDDERAAILGDLSEEFAQLTATSGVRAARRWYVKQTLMSIAPNLLRRFQSVSPNRLQDPRRARMSSMLQDLKFAWRLLRRRPALAVVAGASMAAGIALTATVFSLFDAAVLRPLPVAEPDRLAVVLSRRDTGVNHNFSFPDFVDYRSGQRSFVDLLSSGPATVTVRGQSGALVAEAEMVSGNYFELLEVSTRAGRTLLESDLSPSSPPVAVVSESLWHEIAGIGAAFDGRTAIVNGQAFAIVGIVPRGFRGIQIGRDVRFWAPASQQPLVDPSGGRSYWDRRTASWLTILGRLKPGLTLDRGAADLNRIEAVLGPAVDRQEKRALVLAPGSQGDSFLPGATAEPLRLLLAAALLVLIVAAVNVANLLAARASDRDREMAVRMALGAGRSRLVRLLISDALLIGAASSVIALAAAGWLARVVVPLLPGLADPAALDVGINWRVAGVVGLLGLTTTLVASLAPILRVWRRGTAPALAEGGRTVSGNGRIRRVLVVAQFALSLALVVAAALLIRTLINVRSIDTGLDLNRVVLMEVDPEAAGYDGPRTLQYLTSALGKLGQIPGVMAAGYGRVIPLGFGGSRSSIEVPGYAPKPDEDMEINFNAVSPGYFEALGIALVSGRLPNDQDIAERPRVAVVNETMARRYWPDGAVGRTMRFVGGTPPELEVIGVVRDVKYRFIREEAAPTFYTAALQAPRMRGGVLHVRTQYAPGSLVATLRKTLRDVDRNVPVTIVRTLREQRDRNTADEGLAVTIGVVLGGVALALAAVGLFAAMSSAVVSRRREIGVRLALGADPARIVRLVLAGSLRLVLIGAAIGLIGAYWAVQLLEQRLYGVSAHDPASFVISVLVLALIALAATWGPARRAAGIDPIHALRMTNE
jgi:predicted permease